MAMSNSVETLEALIDPKTAEVRHIAYQIEGVGDFRRENGKWVPDNEEAEPGQFDDLNIRELDTTKAMPLIERWDTGESLSEDDVLEYELSEEEAE